MRNQISPADLSAQRNAALQNRASTFLARENRQAASGQSTTPERPGDQVQLSNGNPVAATPPSAAPTSAETSEAAQDNATHQGLVKNAPSSASGSPQEATTLEPQAPAPPPPPPPSYDSGMPGIGLRDQGAPPQIPPGSGDPSGPPSGPPPSPPSERVQWAQAMAQQQQEEDQVRQIWMNMMAERRKAMAEMWKIIQDTNTKIFEIVQGVAVNRAMSVKKSMDAWSQYILM